MSDGGRLIDDLKIRPATSTDAATIVHFVRELATFEKEPLENVQFNEDAVLEHALGDKPRFEVLIAESDEVPVGMVLFFENFSTWTGRPGIWIEELFIEERYRGRGLGRRLVESVVQLAKDRGFGRVELSVLDWNPAADFYRAHGFKQLTEWQTFRLDLQ